MKPTFLKTAFSIVGCALLLTGGSAFAVDAYSNAVVALNPAGYWPLQETNLPPASPSTTLTNYGTIGSAADGALNGNVVSGKGPVSGGRTIAFDGLADASSAYSRAPYAAGGSPPVPFTIEAWVNTSYPLNYTPANTGGSLWQASMLADYSAPDASHRTGWVLFNDYYKDEQSGYAYGDFSLKSYANGGSSANPHFFTIMPQNTVRAGVWYHLVIVLTSTNAVAYTNGTLSGTFANQAYTYVPNNNSGGTSYGLTMGTRGASSSDYALNWGGVVSEVAYYSNVLTATDALNDYNARTNVATYEALVAARHPVIWYKMDNQPNQPVAKNSGTFGTAGDGYYPTDPSGNNNVLPGVPGPSSSSFPGFGPDANAFQGGVGQINTSGVGVPCAGGNPGVWNLTGSFTISAWAQASSAGTVMELLSHGDRSFRLKFDASSYPHFMYFANDLTGSAAITDGGWHFWTGVYDATSSTMKLYIDGSQSGSTLAVSAPAVGSTASELLLGGTPFYETRNWIGNLAHVAIFTNALSSSTVGYLYGQAQSCGVPPALVTPVFPSSSATCWANSTYVFRPTFFVAANCPAPTYSWTLDSGSGAVTIPGATNATLAFQSIPGLAAGGSYTLAVTATTVNGTANSFVSLTVVAPPTVASTVYSDSFSRTGALNGSRPDLADFYSALWGADGSFTCNGSSVVNSSAYDFAAWLPFIPASGHVYVASCDLNPLNGDDDFLAIGFATGQANGLDYIGRTTYVDARGNRASTSGGVTVVPGTGSGNAALTPFDASGPSTYQVVLDTTTGDASSGWTMSVWEDGLLQYGPEAFGANPSFTSVFMGNYRTGGGVFDNFKLTDSGVFTGPPIIIQNPPAQLFGMQSFTATMPATAAGATSYRWQFNGTDLADNGRITGSHTNRLTLLNIQPGDAGSYQLIAWNSSGSVTSTPCVFTVGTPPIGFCGINEGLWTTNVVSGSVYTGPILASNVLMLTDGGAGEACSAFFNVPQYIGAFYAQFTYQVVNPSGTLGDGAVFCLQNDPRGPAAVGTLAYSYGVRDNITGNTSVIPSVEMTLNLYGALGAVGYSWNTNSSVTWPVQKTPGSIHIDNGDPVAMSLYYNGGTVTLKMVDSGPVATNSFSTTLVQGDLTVPLNSTTAYVGFAGSSGYAGAVSTQIITNFTFVSLPTLPTLSISGNGSGGSVITWPGTLAGFVLEQKGTVTAGNWTVVPNPVTINASGNCEVTIPASPTAKFYRLTIGM